MGDVTFSNRPSKAPHKLELTNGGSITTTSVNKLNSLSSIGGLRNSQNIGKLKYLYDYHQELIDSQVNFEKAVDDSSLMQAAFISLVQKRDLLLETIFYKCFKTGPASVTDSLPPLMHDILFALVDGYKSTLLAFGKFSVRQ